VQRVEVRPQEGCLVIAAQGFYARDRMAREVAGERYLLELACKRPILVKALVRRKQN